MFQLSVVLLLSLAFVFGDESHSVDKRQTTCVPDPCDNGGFCIAFGAQVKCFCPEEFTGDRCETLKSDTTTSTTTTSTTTMTTTTSTTPETTTSTTPETTTSTTTTTTPTTASTTTTTAMTTTTTMNGMTTTTPGEPGRLCSINVCYNQGVCMIFNSLFKCVCPVGFTGDLCEIAVTISQPDGPCTTNVCKNGGYCLILQNQFRCICLIGFTGDLCESQATTTTTTVAPPGQCGNNICYNGGYCAIVSNKFKCFCLEGFTGELCETCTTTTPAIVTGVPELCTPSQDICKNQAVCYITNGVKITCVCPEGFGGDLCQYSSAGLTTTQAPVIITSCSPNPCKYGQCVSYPSGTGFMGCFCYNGYYGKYCDIPAKSRQLAVTVVERCSSSPCRNFGTCVGDAQDKFLGCFCYTGYTGKYCEVAPGCNPNPCMNGGACTSSGCVCPSGYSGTYCEILTTANLCQNIPCQNGGRCNVVSPSQSECWCLGGYAGYYCEVANVGNLCSRTFCLNDGVCEERTPAVTTYAYCMCKPGFTGTRCETEYFRCLSDGLFSDKHGCAFGRYLECKNGVLSRRECPIGTRFNSITGYCDLSSHVRCT